MTTPPTNSWEEKFRSLWQTTRENEGKYEKVKTFIASEREEAKREVVESLKRTSEEVVKDKLYYVQAEDLEAALTHQK